MIEIFQTLFRKIQLSKAAFHSQLHIFWIIIFQSNDEIYVILILCITSCVNLSILVLLIGWVVNWYPKTHLTTELMKPWENCFHQNVFLHLHYITMKAICCIYFLRLPKGNFINGICCWFYQTKEYIECLWYEINWSCTS